MVSLNSSLQQRRRRCLIRNHQSTNPVVEPQGISKKMQNMPSLPEISPHELKQKLDENEAVFLLDVREPSEYDIVHLEGARLIPLNTLPHHVESLPSDQEIVVYCHHGTRSFYAVAYLHQNGFHDAKNLAGGIDQWAAEIDPTLQRY